MLKSKITATGSYLPKKILTNFDLEKMVDTSDDWILQRTGIKERRIAADDELTSDLAAKALLDMIDNYGVDKESIDAIIVATTTPDLIFPSTAIFVQKKLGIKNCFAFDLQAVCSGFLYAIMVANSMIVSNQAKKIAIIGAETFSRIVDWSDRNTCVLFGDGAGAMMLEASDDTGILKIELFSDPTLSEILKVDGGISCGLSSGKVLMNGKEVFRNAIEKMSDSILNVVQNAGYTIEDVDFIIPHQANHRIFEGISKRLKFPLEKIISTVDHQANTSAATIPLAFDYSIKNNKISKGNLVVFSAIGGGMTWGSCLAIV